MKNFSFNQREVDDSREIENIIKARRRKIARQQRIYTIILILIISMICIWLYRKTVYVEFDGYVSLDMTQYRSGDDIYFLKSYVSVGDLALPGDTLFSYAIAQNFFNHTHNDYEPTIISRNRDLKTQYGLARQDLDVLRVRIQELERQLSTEDHNIRFGLSDNHNKLRTEQELAEAREQYNALRRKLGVLWNAVAHSNQSMGRLNNNGHGYAKISLIYDYDLLRDLGLVYYAVSVDSSLVTKKFVPSNSFVLRGETILSLQSLRAHDNNLAVVAYVMPDQMKHVNYHSKAEVIVSDEISYTASVIMLGARTEEIPGELRSTLSRDHTASIVVFDIDPNQDIPFWTLTNGVPVKIRINKFTKEDPVIGDYIIYNTSTGVYKETLIHSQHDCNIHPTHKGRRPGSAYHDTVASKPAAQDSAQTAIKRVVIPASHSAAAKQTAAKPAAAKPAAKPAVKTTANIVGYASGPYRIIVGSGSDKSGAMRHAARLRKMGYSHATVLSEHGVNRVCISSFPKKKDADLAIKQLKKKPEFTDAWTLYQK